jgi:hypothetical protein
MHSGALCSGKALQTLLNHSPQLVAATNTRSQTPMHHAAMSGNVGAIKVLAEFGADVNAKDIDGLIPLHNAWLGTMTIGACMTRLSSGDYDFYKTLQVDCLQAREVLINLGADQNAKNNNGMNPSQAAFISLFEIAMMDKEKEAPLRMLGSGVYSCENARTSNARAWTVRR